MMHLLIFLLAVHTVFAASSFHLGEVKVICPKSIECEQRTNRFQTLSGEYRSLIHLKDTLRVMVSDGGYKSFFYQLSRSEDAYTLDIKFQLKPIINEINISFTDRNIDYDSTQLIGLRQGDFFEIQKVKENMDGLKERLAGMGFPNNTSSFEVIEKNNKVTTNIVVTLGSPRIFKNIKSDSHSIYVKRYLSNKFLNLYNKPFDLNRFKIYLDDAQKELFSYGYYLINLDFKPVLKGNRVTLDIKVQNDQLFAFDFKNLLQEHRNVIHNLITELFRKYKRPVTESTLKNALKDHYQHKALLNARIRIETSEFVNKDKETVNLYRIYFDENVKTKLLKVTFLGNNFFSRKRLERMFKKGAFELASLKFYDDEYFDYFQEYLRDQYIKNGFVLVRVPDPAKILDSEKKVSSVEYTIQEGTRAFTRKIEFEGMPQDIEDKMLLELSNKTGKPFNPISLAEDIKMVANYLQELGYYYAEVVNINDADFVTYSKSGSDVDIKFKIVTGPLVRLNRILFLGNNKTRESVLSRKIFIKPNEIITPSRTKEIEAALSATGLFNTVSVSPLRHSSKNARTDLLVKVTEREYGLFEVAPGYRTDLGIKLTGTYQYQNIAGRNQSLQFVTSLNQRLDFTTLDPERSKKVSSLLEHNETITYTKGDIWDTYVNASTSIGYQRRRFYAFDADIARINGTLTRDISKRTSVSVTYQYEDINQFNATLKSDEGKFKIGAFTPNLTYDLRNSQINPLKGAFFNLSCEFANPYFLSQKENDLTINYYKLISRNRFYIPFKNGTVAISMVGGIQENLSKDLRSVNNVTQTQGYIPRIKVFRLTGMDIIRGYTDQEMNRLPDNKDISEVRVDNKAYLANFKFEPRYFISDTVMTGVFYDAGRVFVNQLDFSEIRDSVGVSFKILTPVGTLDFDYGIKLLRKRDASGSLESPGRFHVSIGFF
jgi:outer membrane protein insertion porin family